MKISIPWSALVFATLLSALSNAAVAGVGPVAKLVQAQGDVQYSRNGDKWRLVRGTKYLFAGYQVKTGSNGGGKVIDEETGKSQALGTDSWIKVGEKAISVVKGSLSAPKEESTSLFQSIANKFVRAQRYTTVRRGVTETQTNSCNNKVRTIRHVTLSPAHPDLVWRNACPEYSYRLVIDGKGHAIPAESTAEMIRYSAKGVSPGEHRYHVEVLDKDGTIYIPRKESTFTMLSSAQQTQLDEQLAKYSSDVFQQADLLENKNMYVAAMDAYRDYFKNNPDDNDMRPLLIAAYQKLKLSNLREREARLYNADLVEESE